MCGAWGPTDADGRVYLCRYRAGHDDRHRNCTVYPSKRWGSVYVPQIVEGELVATHRRGTYPGPLPAREAAEERERRLEAERRQARLLEKQREELERITERAKKRWRHNPNAPPPLCDHVDVLEPTACRKPWVANAHQQADQEGRVRHVCHESRANHHDSRCICACTRETREETQAADPLPATDEAQQTLEEVPLPPVG